MPIEIKNLTINATVDSGTSHSKRNTYSEKEMNMDRLQERIVQECMDRILEKITEQYERW